MAPSASTAELPAPEGVIRPSGWLHAIAVSRPAAADERRAVRMARPLTGRLSFPISSAATPGGSRSTDPSSSMVVMSPGSRSRITALSTRRISLPLRVLGSIADEVQLADDRDRAELATDRVDHRLAQLR